MELKNIRKRQGLSLKKIKEFQLTKKIEQSIRKDQQDAQKLSIKKINSIKSINSRKLLPRSKTSQNTKHQSNPYLDDQQKPKKFLQRKQHTKFSKLLLNCPISKCDENIHELVDQISPKAKGFYRFGMKSYQKNSHKRVFSDVMNLPKQNMNGLMHIGQLWGNSTSTKYLKLNKINMNKMKFFQKLRDLKWQKIKKQRQKQLDSSNLIHSVREFNQKSQKSINSFTHFQSLLSFKHLHSTVDHDDIVEEFDRESHKRQRSQQFERNSKTYRQALSVIRGDIDGQYKRCKDEEYWKNMKGLQKESQQMHKLWDKYFGKMLQMN